MPECRDCNKPIQWLAEKTSQKRAVFEMLPHPKGKYFIHGREYREATKDEISKALESGQPLFRKHFAVCAVVIERRMEKARNVKLPPFNANNYEQDIMELVVTPRDLEMVKIWKTYDKTIRNSTSVITPTDEGEFWEWLLKPKTRTEENKLKRR